MTHRSRVRLRNLPASDEVGNCVERLAQTAESLRYTGRDANVHHTGVAPARRSGETVNMRTTDLDIAKLSLAERIQLAEDLWDSVAAETGGLALTEAQATELDHRLAQLARDPEGGDAWEVVRGRIQERLDKAG